MKKILLPLFSLFLLLVLTLSSCSVNNKEQDIYKNANGFEAVLSVTKGEENFTFSVSRLKPDYFELNFTNPPILQNFYVIFSNGEVTLKYYGFELSLNRFPLPITNGISRIVDVLALLDDGFEKLELKSNQDNELIYGGNGFTVSFSPETLLPISFEIETDDGESYKITVESFALLTPDNFEN